MREKQLIQDVRFPGFGTSLPASPSDGDLFILVDSLTAPTYHWMLRYVAAKASDKWVFVGGAAARVEVLTDESTTTTGTWLNLATSGPNFAVPVAGDYEVHLGANTYHTVAQGVIATGVAVGDGTPSIALYGNAPGASQLGHVATGKVRLLDMAASGVIRQRYWMNTAGTAHWTSRWIGVTPVALGG